jgi:hypothetical protein
MAPEIARVNTGFCLGYMGYFGVMEGSWEFFYSLPARVIADDEQCIKKGCARLAQSVLHLLVQRLIGGGTPCACFPYQGVKRWQFIAVANQDFDADIDNVRHIFLGQCGVAERGTEQCLALSREWLYVQESPY